MSSEKLSTTPPHTATMPLPTTAITNSPQTPITESTAAASAINPTVTMTSIIVAPGSLGTSSFKDEEVALASSGDIEPSPPALNDFSPVLSKSAKRRQRAWKVEGAQALNEQLGRPMSHTSTPNRPIPQPSFATTPNTSHMEVHHAPAYRQNQHGQSSALIALADMFPNLEPDVLASLYASCGSFDRVVEYMLAHDTTMTREDRELQAAINASVASSSPTGSLSASPLPLSYHYGVDHLSPLSMDLLFPICEYLDLFELSNLCGTNKELQTEVEQFFSGQVDTTLDFSKARFAHWSDWRILRMIHRFSGVQQISLRNTNFRSFYALHEETFGHTIRSLNFSGCPELEDRDCLELFDLGENLTHLDLSLCDITDEGLEHIATARQNQALERLILNDCKFISSLGVQRVLEKCISLRHLDLKGTNVNRSILSFTQQDSKLTVLNLSFCRKLPAELSITSCFCQLTALNLGENPALKNVTLSIPTLINLNLSNSKHIQSLTLYTPKLVQLNLNGCLVLANIASYAIHSKTFVSALSVINMNGCRSITGLSFQTVFMSAKSTMRSLTCRGCLLLNDANLELFIRDESNEPSSSSTSSSSTTPPGGLEFIDLSGCKLVSPTIVLTLQRQVAAHQAQLLRHSQEHAVANTLPTSRSSFGLKPSSSTSWSHPPLSGPQAEDEVLGLDEDERDGNDSARSDESV